MATCNITEGFQNRASDAITEWKPEYAHRTFCNMLEGVCDAHDKDNELSAYQNQLRMEIECLENNLDYLKGLLAKHQEKWGKRE